MCVGPELMLIASMAANAGGTYLDNKEADANALREVRARNDVLRQQNAKQDAFAQQSRDRLSQNLGDMLQLEPAQQSRTMALEAAVPDTAPGPQVPLSSDAPKIVNEAFARQAREAVDRSKQTAAGLGRLGGFGDQLFGNAMGNQAAGRDIGTNNNFSRGEAALTPALQQYAALEAYKPSSGTGALLKGLGTALGYASGAGGTGGAGGMGAGAMAAKDPWAGLRLVMG